MLKIFPWVLIAILFIWIYLYSDKNAQEKIVINNDIVIEQIESLGKLELVKYNFKEITELKKISPEYLKFFKLGPDSKIALISIGEATGCLDLTKIKDTDVLIEGDTIYVNLPKAELCYYKLNLEKSRIYSLDVNPLIDEKEFIQSAYKSAEGEIKKSALNSGILQQTEVNAEKILKPILEKISGKKVIITKRPNTVQMEISNQ